MPSEKRIAVLTSGGDAQGMNAAVRAVGRTALNRGVQVFAVHEGYKGMVEGGDRIVPITWDSTAGIMHLGGTVIGTARCPEFLERAGRLRAVEHLLSYGIDRLVVIGGDGTLTGAALFHREWPGLVAELVQHGRITRAVADRHPGLYVAGLVGSIDNDMAGTDMTIGADSALHRITEAIDAISSTAASHQRTFVVEVMGRRCGYLAVRSAIAGSADWVLIPEDPPAPGWEDDMCRTLQIGREHGRRDSIVVVAEGAVDRSGNAITSAYIRAVLEERLGEDTRVTVLGHVQRGGTPSAFDRYMSTVLGSAAVDELLSAEPGREPQVIGLRNTGIMSSPLIPSVNETVAITTAMKAGDHAAALEQRGPRFAEGLKVAHTLMKVFPAEPRRGQRRLRLAVLHAGGPAPGMNTAARVAIRLGLDEGHQMLGVRYGFGGLVEGDLDEMSWMDVSGWVSRGGAELGVTRRELSGKDLYAIGRTIEEQRIDGLLVIGGWSGYVASLRLYSERANFPTFNLPIALLPATIDNNLPGSEQSIGADTALNSIVMAIDRIKQSAVASGRCFVVEVMGRYCGFLATVGGLATGAERVFTHEEGITLASLQEELGHTIAAFEDGKRLSLIVRNENANAVYSTEFIAALFEEEGGERFSARKAILGHQQQGGSPSPFDRILATRLASNCIDFLIREAGRDVPGAALIGVREGQIRPTGFEDLPRLADVAHQRPKQQWWTDLHDVARLLARPAVPSNEPR